LHVHDTPVQVLAETGLLGELAFFGAIAAALLKLRRTIGRARRRRDRSAARLTMAIEISIWGFLVCGLAGGYLTSWFPYILLGLASAACAIPAPRPLRSSPAPLPADWSIETCAASPAS